jgi:hypothetical protein
VAATEDLTTLAVNTTTGLYTTINTVHTDTTSILGSVTFTNGPRFDALTVDDSAWSYNERWNIQNTSISLAGVVGGSINWTNGSVNTLTVLGGSGNNTYTVNAPQAYLGTTLNTGSGADTIDVLADSAPLTVTTTTGSSSTINTVHVGNAGTVRRRLPVRYVRRQRAPGQLQPVRLSRLRPRASLSEHRASTSEPGPQLVNIRNPVGFRSCVSPPAVTAVLEGALYLR